MPGFDESIVHLDMDAFFVEVERRQNPELAGRPVLVGGLGNRSVVASASYEARRQGVSSGMPMGHARRLAPAAVVVPPDHTAYRVASDQVFEVLSQFTPNIEPVSVDEAFLEVSGLKRHYDSAVACVDAMRRAVREATGLPASAGVATSKLIAKMASRDAKPDGICLVPSGGEVDYLAPQPVRSLWGVGEATHARLEELGLRTIGDIAEYPRSSLIRRLGESLGATLWDLANAIDPRTVGAEQGGRSISVEETFAVDLVRVADMDKTLLGQADRLAERLRRAGVVAYTLSLKVRYPDFTTVTRSHTSDGAVSTSAEMFETARSLLSRTAASDRGVRLLGISADGLEDDDAPRQLDLDPGPWEEIDQAVDDIRQRFGSDAVGRAALTDPSPPPRPPA